jgi:serine/threonine-protein kinase
VTDATVSAFAGALRDRYTLERELGRGGMATVYLAHDLKHDRKVALKVVHPELAATLGPERFQREIRTTARLQHPHILPVLDSGEGAGQLWYTMPFVDGESLRDRLRRERQLPLEEALQLTREVADALGYAHEQGIVHRDIKPENILLSRGHALVADFGVARALQEAGRGQLTGTGVSVGTPAYMSPEQALADPAVDGRSDLYSLGCVLYEMLAGEAPYTGMSPQAIVAKRLREPIPHVRTVRDTVPPSVDRALERVLAKAAADRYMTAASFAADLVEEPSRIATEAGSTVAELRPSSRRLAVPMGLTLLVAVIAGAFLRTLRAPATDVSNSGNQPIRLVVLPFENIGDTANVFFADGLAGELRGRLATLPALQVIGATSSNTYRHTTRAPQVIGRELGVQYLLMGQVQWAREGGSGGQVRVRPELIDARTGATRWGEPFDGPASDLFRVQSDIASRVAEALGIALEAGVRATLASGTPRSPAAYEAYLRAKAAYEELSSTGAEGSAARVRAYAREALAYDSLYAPAWSMLARGYVGACLSLPCIYGDSAKAAANRALSLDPGLADGYRALVQYAYGLANDADEAIRVAEAGLRHVPNSPELLANLGWALMARGQWDRAAGALEHAQTFDPRSGSVLYSYARLLAYRRRWDDLREVSRRGRAVEPRNAHFVAWPMIAALAEGDSALARRVFEEGSPGLDMATLARSLVHYFDETLIWVMPERARLLLLADPAPVEDQARWDWARGRSGVYRLRGDTLRARMYSDSALRAVDRILPAPKLPVEHGMVALIAADARQSERARREIALAQQPSPKPDAMFDVVATDLSALALLRLGDRDAALARWRDVLRRPYWLTAKWIRIAPEYAPLRAGPGIASLEAVGVSR